ncbi:methyl farnesoate epoxidase-like [Venturia canescens]|uniref:methyl farnesoate epoxidase-like n=1 Tax=Venturia canescens TaxID=32260 RepID=UPI001C9D38DF|nr:methyl farnesoate epoxidase-like [Venturia canescens]
MIALLILLASVLFCFYECLKPRRFPPGPAWFPFVGCLLIFQRLRAKHGYVHLAFEELAKTYGPIVGVKLGNQKFVVVSSQRLVKKVLLADEFNGRPDGFFFRVRAFGARTGVLFTEGATWHHNRRFTMKYLRAFGFGQASMHDYLTFEAQDLVRNLRERGKGGTPVEMHSAFDVGVLNALWMMLAGHRFSYDDANLQEILRVVHDAFRITDTLGGLVSQIPVLRYIIPELCGYNNLISVLEKLWAFIGDEIDKHEADARSNNHGANDLIDACVSEMIRGRSDPESQTFDRKDIVVLCLDLFLAGSKTTTDALAITFAFLARNPKWLKIMQADLDSVVGRDRDPVLADAARVPRVEAFLAEVQRTLVLTPLGVPHSTTKNVSLEGYDIPKDTTVLLNLNSAHKDGAVWERPEEFHPERFLDENGQFNRKHEFMQFGLGKRRCMGETLARASLFLFFTHIVHHFDIEVSQSHGLPSLDGTDGFVISPKPYHLVLTPRS